MLATRSEVDGVARRTGGVSADSIRLKTGAKNTQAPQLFQALSAIYLSFLKGAAAGPRRAAFPRPRTRSDSPRRLAGAAGRSDRRSRGSAGGGPTPPRPSPGQLAPRGRCHAQVLALPPRPPRSRARPP